MSADVDQEDKTEEPTEKRLHDAAEKGQIAFSREAPLFASLSAALVALVFVIPGRADDPVRRARRASSTTPPAGASRAARTRSRWRDRWLRRRGRIPLADRRPAVARGRRRLRRPVGAAHRAGPHHAGFFAHLAARRLAAYLRRPRAGRIRQEPDQGRRGRIRRGNDAGRPEGRAADGDERRSSRACRNASSRWPSGRSRRCWSRPLP